MQTLTYVIGKDRRALVDNVQNFTVDFNDAGIKNWVQARQYEDTMRQIFVNVQNEDGTPFDLTNVNPVFEGRLPGGKYAVLDSKHGVVLDPLSGQFRFDMPARAFAIAGSYQQAFFRLYKDGQNITTLEFNLEVLADKVISGIIPSDYITPFEDLYSKLEAILTKGDADVKKVIAEFTEKFNTLFHDLNTQGELTKTMITTCQNRLKSLEEKILQDGLFTQAEADESKKYILGSIVQSDMVDRVINEVQTLQMTDLGPTSEPFSVDQVAQATDDGYNAGLVIGPTADYSIEEVKSL